MTPTEPFDLSRFPVHLGLGATVERLEEFDGSADWYERYGAAHASDGAEGRLVSLHTFAEPWTTWEMHPEGAELVACLDGVLTLHQEIDGGVRTVVLEAGQAIVNPPGVWHTADVDRRATACFVTAGVGTEMRAR
jgi:quercetin dioxygenase-like cupin family protein